MKALIVVDMQVDFINGSLGTKEAVAIVPNVIKKIEEYENMDDAVIVYTKDTHLDNYLETSEGKKLPVVHCIKGTPGWEIPSDILRGHDAHVIEKPTFGSFDLIDLMNELQPDEIELIGLCTDICVVSNALLLKANFYETPISVDSSCCAGVTPKTHEDALSTMRMCQIDVK